jgi:hypothetical protein
MEYLIRENCRKECYRWFGPGFGGKKHLRALLKLMEIYPKIQDTVLKYISVINVFFTELNVDFRLRRHIEGCIGWNLRNKHPEASVLYPPDNRVVARKEKNQGELIIQTPELIRGLDKRIPY